MASPDVHRGQSAGAVMVGEPRIDGTRAARLTSGRLFSVAAGCGFLGLGGAAQQLRHAATRVDPAQFDQVREMLARGQFRSLEGFAAFLHKFLGRQNLSHRVKFGRKMPKMQAGFRTAT